MTISGLFFVSMMDSKIIDSKIMNSKIIDSKMMNSKIMDSIKDYFKYYELQD